LIAVVDAQQKCVHKATDDIDEKKWWEKSKKVNETV